MGGKVRPNGASFGAMGVAGSYTSAPKTNVSAAHFWLNLKSDLI